METLKLFAEALAFLADKCVLTDSEKRIFQQKMNNITQSLRRELEALDKKDTTTAVVVN